MWIILSLISTFSQIVRNLLSKELTKELPIRVISLSRFLFALPIVFISYLILSGFLGKVTLINAEFYFWIILMAISQILATLFRISLFNYKSFAVSLTIVQIDGVFTALLALAFLGETLSLTAWIGVMTASTGLILATLSKNSVTIANIKRTLFTKASLIALLTGLFLALAALFAKKATMFLSSESKMLNSIYTLMFILTAEVAILFPIVLRKHPDALKKMILNPVKPMVIGLCSGIGSFGWITSYSLVKIAYVRTVGQLEFIFATLISLYYFKEKIYKIEFLGMVMVISGALLLIFLR